MTKEMVLLVALAIVVSSSKALVATTVLAVIELDDASHRGREDVQHAVRAPA